MIRKYGLVIGAALLSATMWLWVQDIAIARQLQEAAVNGSPRGLLSDLYPRWLGARELLLHRRDPYGDDVTREIQTGYYGRPVDPSRPGDPKDRQAFAYPLYVVFLLAPTVNLPFALVQKGFFWLLVALSAASVLLWMNTIGWRTGIPEKLASILLVLGCFPVVQGLKLQQLTLLVGALLAACTAAVVRRHLVWAGILLALATIKPQLVILFALWLLIWVLGNWRERQSLVWAFLVSMGVLVVASELLLPGWIGEFRPSVASYYQYTGGGQSVLDILLTPRVGRVAAAILATAGLIAVWRNRKAAATTGDFHWSLALVLSITLLCIPMPVPYNQVILLPAVVLVAHNIAALWQRTRLLQFCLIGTGILLLWPWIAVLLLVSAMLVMPSRTVQKEWALPLYTTLTLPVSLLVLLLAGRRVLGRKNGNGRKTIGEFAPEP